MALRCTERDDEAMKEDEAVGSAKAGASNFQLNRQDGKNAKEVRILHRRIG
ncbi:MAG: hypothetical protein GX811_02075 [Lentisphaerae bacterium]|nr:hypothetical protein [Lentisphaerota bacterium]